MAISDFPIIDWSPIGKLPDVYEKGAERAREAAFREQLAGGLPMKNGVVDWNAAAQIAARAGNMGGISQFAQLATAQAQRQQAAANAAEMARHNRAVEGAYYQPKIQWDEVDPTAPPGPRWGTAVITDKQGNVRYERVQAGGGGPQPQQTAPPQQPVTPPDIWNRGGGGIPTPGPPPVGPGAALDVPGGPAMAQAAPEPSLTERLLAEGQQPLPPRGPQLAGPYSRDIVPPQPAPVTPPPAPVRPPPAAPMAQPDWLAGAAAPVMGQGPIGAPQANGGERVVMPRPPDAKNPESILRDQSELLVRAPMVPPREGARDESVLASLSAGAAADVKAIADYRKNLAGLKGTQQYKSRIGQLVYQYDKDYNEQNYPRFLSGIKAYGAGVEGRATRSFSVAMDHIDAYLHYMKALDSGDIRVINAARNAFKTHFGQEAPTNAAAAGAILGPEIAKAIIGGQNALQDREEYRHQLSTAASPRQAIGLAEVYSKFLGGQLLGYRNMFPSLTGRQQVVFDAMLSPGAKRVLLGAQGGEGGGGATAIRPEHITTLKARPDTAPLFDKKYGTPDDPNPSRRYLGGGQ